MAWDRRRGYNFPAHRRSTTFGRSGWATALVIAIVLIGFGLVWHAHQRAKFHQFTTPTIPQTTSAPMPGGQEAMLLSRVALVNDAEPEFVSVAVLPGIGMQVLQITVAVPDQPTQDLLASVPVSDAAELPPASVHSAPFSLRVSTHHLPDRGTADDLIGFAPAEDAENQTLVDGGQASGTFHGTAAKSGVSAKLEVTLSGRQIDLVARATNSGAENRYVAFDWSPTFLAPEGDLSRLGLAIPSRSAAGANGERTAGAVAAALSTERGQPVGNQPFDLRFAHLGREFLSDGTYVQLQNGDRYYLRIIGLGDTLRSVHARNDPAAHRLLLDLSSIDSTAEAEQRDQVLRPGQTMQWHLRIEVLPVKAPQGPDPGH